MNTKKIFKSLFFISKNSLKSILDDFNIFIRFHNVLLDFSDNKKVGFRIYFILTA